MRAQSLPEDFRPISRVSPSRHPRAAPDARPAFNGDSMALSEYDDYEQSERVQQWLRANGISIIVGIVIGLLLIFGWQQWKAHRSARQAEAAARYQQFQSALADGNTKAAQKLLANLKSDYASSAETVFAASLNAQQEVDANHLDKAHASLAWARKHADNPTLKALISLRLARVELGQGKAKDALGTLAGIDNEAFKASIQELRGDALVKTGQHAEARTAYKAAMAAMNKDAPQYGVTKMKLDNLAAAGKQGA